MPVTRVLASGVAVGALVLSTMSAAGAAPDREPVPDPAAGPQSKQQVLHSGHASTVKVMTRNVFLGADLGRGLAAPDLDRLMRGAGQILNKVDENDFDKRGDALAHEIRSQKPDLIGLQEVANWRTAPCGSPFLPPQATQVRYDFLRMLMSKLNSDGRTYRIVETQPQFDFEIPANTTRDPAQQHCDTNVRLTMRDVILARTDGREIRTRKARGGTYENLLTVRPGDLVDFPAKRGWLSVDAKVGKGPWFRFVNTHLESFDDESQRPSIRKQQAQELVEDAGPIGSSNHPVVLVGDLNSDIRTEVKPGDAQAYRALRNAGLYSKAGRRPLSCCLHLPALGPDADRADNAQRDHVVDHIMTDAPWRVWRLRSSVTGLEPHNGWWGSDHAGVVSTLLMLG